METIMEVPEISFEATQKILQQQLVLVLHAHGCQKQDFTNSYSDDSDEETPKKEKCKLPFCEDTKKCLDHIRCCLEPEACQVPHCLSNREIIRHWKTCQKKKVCPICRPVFQAQQSHRLKAR